MAFELLTILTASVEAIFTVSESYKQEVIKMTAKAKIKVIKKGEAKAAEIPVETQAKPKQAAREMVSTVSNWVSEFQQRRREETKQAIEKFFSNQPQTNGA